MRGLEPIFWVSDIEGLDLGIDERDSDFHVFIRRWEEDGLSLSAHEGPSLDRVDTCVLGGGVSYGLIRNGGRLQAENFKLDGVAALVYLEVSSLSSDLGTVKSGSGEGPVAELISSDVQPKISTIDTVMS